jgi:hypothetical protein
LGQRLPLSMMGLRSDWPLMPPGISMGLILRVRYLN